MVTEARFAPGDLVAVLTTQPLDRTLDYKAPEGGVGVGDFVEVPLGPRKVMGVVWGAGAGDFDRAKIKPVLRRMDVPPMTAELRGFLERVADYTITSMPAMLRLATRVPGLGTPPGMRKIYRLGKGQPDRMTEARKRVLDVMADHGGAGFAPTELAQLAGVSSSVVKGLADQGVLVLLQEPRDRPFARMDAHHPGKALSAEQEKASRVLRKAVADRAYQTILLKGVTGSGKTEVYLEAVAECLAQGRQALVLLPEIALTGAFLDRIEERFGAPPAQWHSGVTQAERRRAWGAVADGSAQVVIGARSALFLPFQNLGLVVVDEEHDTSYKQEDGVLYHARDMAVMRAARVGATVVLASATPSLESWANAKAGKYARVDLPHRYGTAVLPAMSAVDLRLDPAEQGAWISPVLHDAIAARLDRGEQSLMFLNRRGYAPLTLCRACGHQIGCSDCDARMVEHRFHQRLICHQCGASRVIPDTCPECGQTGTLAALGPGVERLAEEVIAHYPDARVAILSSDLTDSARRMKSLIEEIAAGGADIIIGTQIVAKGHNFPNLTLVGVIDADLGLQGGDLRAAERSFQLIRQVAGRAGRAERPGEVLVQTHQPLHPVIEAILSEEEEAFWETEARARQEAGAPPYGRMAGVILSGPDLTQLTALSRDMIRQVHLMTTAGAQVFGPAPAPIARVRGQHRIRFLVKGPKGLALQPALKAWRAAVKPPANARIALDIDPQSFF